MMNTLPGRRLAAICALVLLSACASTPSTPTFDTSGERSFDGLVPLSGTTMRNVWAREDVDLSKYTKFMVVNAGLHYRPVSGSSSSRARSSASAFPLTAAQKERMQSVVTEEFRNALAGVENIQQVDSPGPDVLIVRGGMIDIVSRVPPERPGRTDVFLDSVGQATLVIELIDSQSDAVLVRAVDTRAAQSSGFTQRSTRVTNTAEVRRLAARWAQMLASALERLTSITILNG